MKQVNTNNKKTKQFWTIEQDNLLKEIVSINRLNLNWNKIATNFGDMNSKQCYYRYRNINPMLKKGHWSEKEEQTLKDLYNLHGGKWSMLSKNFGGTRSGKQIRLHYTNISDNHNRKTKFAQEEDFRIHDLHTLYRSNWIIISSFFNGRSADNIKCRYYNTRKKALFNFKHHIVSSKTKTINNNPLTQKFKFLLNMNEEAYKSNDKVSNDNENPLFTKKEDKIVNEDAFINNENKHEDDYFFNAIFGELGNRKNEDYSEDSQSN